LLPLCSFLFRVKHTNTHHCQFLFLSFFLPPFINSSNTSRKNYHQTHLPKQIQISKMPQKDNHGNEYSYKSSGENTQVGSTPHADLGRNKHWHHIQGQPLLCSRLRLWGQQLQCLPLLEPVRSKFAVGNADTNGYSPGMAPTTTPTPTARLTTAPLTASRPTLPLPRALASPASKLASLWASESCAAGSFYFGHPTWFGLALSEDNLVLTGRTIPIITSYNWHFNKTSLRSLDT
jgi:hypothetical protein